MNPAARGSDVNAVGGTLYRAPELSDKSCLVVCHRDQALTLRIRIRMRAPAPMRPYV